MSDALKLLRIDASARGDMSESRRLGDRLIEALKARHAEITVQERDVAGGAPFVDAAWIDAAFSEEDQLDERQWAALAMSDVLIDEFIAAEILVITTPIYNFGPPAGLKAWIDQICRRGRTFNYGEQGAVALTPHRPTFLIVTSGGTPIGGEFDFATGYLQHVLAFLGIEDVTLIKAEGLAANREAALEQAYAQIDTALL